MAEPTAPQEVALWLGAAASSFMMLFGILKLRSSDLDRIQAAKAEGTEAKAECIKLEQKILQTQLDATSRFASIPHLRSVEQNMKDEIIASEKR